MAGNENFTEKSMFITLKVKTSSKFVLWQPDEISIFDPKFKKKKKSEHQTQSERKFSKKKICLVCTLKV
jgi:hypothetical protein